MLGDVDGDDATGHQLAGHGVAAGRLQHALDAGTLPRELPDAISQAGDILARALPAPKKNMDELPNELHLID